MEEKFEIELKQTVQFNSIFDAIEPFCCWLIDNPNLPTPEKLTEQNINVLFSMFINENVYWTPYEIMKFTNYQAEVRTIPDFLYQCIIVFDRCKKEHLQVQKEHVERLAKQLKEAEVKLKALQ